MRRSTCSAAAAVALAAFAAAPGVAGGPAAAGTRVAVLETPDGGIQPQAAVAPDGSILLVYFKGDPAGGDAFHARAAPGRTRFSGPTRVNSRPGSVVAAGTIRGAQIAAGRGGRVHVAWNGSAEAGPADPGPGPPMLYARSDPEGTAFEPQRNLMRRTSDLDGGGTLAAGRGGDVYVGWHARSKGAPEGEAGRRFYVARSRDDGATFGAEEPALARETGACGCCGTRGLADARGNVYFLYRAATGGVGRDTTLLASRDGGSRFEGRVLHPWRLSACPMSSASLAEGGGFVAAAWETAGQVYFCRIAAGSFEPSPAVSPAGGGDAGGRKHPAAAVNSKGETLLAWAEGTGWGRGGALAWQVFDRSGRPSGEPGRIEAGVPAWGLPCAVAGPDDGFTIIH